MIEVGKLCELSGKATEYTAPRMYGSGSWSPGMSTGCSTNTVKVSTNTFSSTGNTTTGITYGSPTISSSSFNPTDLNYGVLCEEYVDPYSMTLKEYSYYYLHKPCKFMPNGTIGLVVDISTKTLPFGQQVLCRILIEDRLYVVFLDELKELGE